MVTSGINSNCTEFSFKNFGGVLVYRNVVAILVLDFLVALCTVVTNTVFLLTMIKTTALHSPANVAVSALFACDLIVGLFAQSLYLAILFSIKDGRVTSHALELAFETVFLLCSGFSSLIVALVSFDRYYAVCRPYKYRRVITSSKFIKLIIFCSVIWSIFVASLLASQNLFEISQWVFFILILSVMVIVLCSYYSILRVIQGQRQTAPMIGCVSVTGSSDQSVAKREKKHSRIMGLIIGVFLALHLPYLGFTIYFVGWRVPLCSDSVLVMYLWDEFFLLLSSCTNPILYGLKRKDISSAALNMLKC